MTTTDTKPTTRTITLTSRPPVKIRDDQWPIIANDRWWAGEIEVQADRSGWLKVRQHADGRTIVYGGYDTRWQGDHELRAGELLDKGANVAAAIHRVAESVNAQRIAESTIAELSAEEI